MARSPRKVALLIGNGQFDDPELKALTAPLADVEALREVLVCPSIGKFDKVDVLSDASFADASAAIGNLFEVKSSEDTILLYYSGHGLLDVRGHLYLTTKNTSAANPNGSSIAAAEIKRTMSTSLSRRQVLVLDCCYSGAFGAAKGGAHLAISTETFKTQGFGQHVLTASSSVQRAYEGNQEIDGIETSLFTHFLIRGLKTGKAARGGEEHVTVVDLYRYVHRCVVDHTNKMEPHLWIDESEGDLVISRNPSPHQVPDEVNEMLESDDRYIREGAVRILGRWLHASEPEKRDLAARTLRERDLYEQHRFVAAAIQEELKSADAGNDSTAANEAAATDEEAESKKSTETFRTGSEERKLGRWGYIAGFTFVLAIGALAAAVYFAVEHSVAVKAIDELEKLNDNSAARVSAITVEHNEVRTELKNVMDERDKLRKLLENANEYISILENESIIWDNLSDKGFRNPF